jgi:predicted phage gp36 major capsid-like protein
MDNTDTTSVATTMNNKTSTEYLKNMDEFKTEIRSEFKSRLDALQTENNKMKQSIEEKKQESSLEQIEQFMLDQKVDYEKQE